MPIFNLGGHSLKAAMVVKRYKDLQVSIPLNKIFENPTIDALASFINLIQLKEKLTRATTVPGVDDIREEFIL
jgi:hypothetical protein